MYNIYFVPIYKTILKKSKAKRLVILIIIYLVTSAGTYLTNLK